MKWERYDEDKKILNYYGVVISRILSMFEVIYVIFQLILSNKKYVVIWCGSRSTFWFTSTTYTTTILIINE